MKLNVKIALEVIESFRTRDKKNSYCFDVYGKSYEEIKKYFWELLQDWIETIEIDII